MGVRILVTGGSGFIGTNLIENFIDKGFEVRNIDIKKPKLEKRESIWKKIDICNYTELNREINDFIPEYVVHLAARTDLDGEHLLDYATNIEGIANLLKAIRSIPVLKKVIVTSSKLVTQNGYTVKGQFDYCPNTLYGKSKVETEKIVWNNKPFCDWCIIRPTSIWGPWFGIPYRNFFDMVVNRIFFHIGNTKCYKTYGYIGNSVYQISQLLFTNTESEENKVFYIGDEPSYEINEWADEIAEILNYKIAVMPFIAVKFISIVGDFLNLFRVHFPMQSFRFKNMTTDNINDIRNTIEIAPNPPFERQEGNILTLQWLKKEKELKKIKDRKGR